MENIEIRYYWKELSDGLNEPESIGPYYSIDINERDGFKSEESALKRLDYLVGKYGYDTYNLILCKFVKRKTKG